MSETSNETYDSVSFYIVAHQDDWQLFMTPDAYDDLIRHNTKVTFIYSSAGDAGNDSTYWLAREKGALRSVQYALDSHQSPPQEIITTQKSVAGHLLHYCRYKDVGNYFLRLPDGCMSGKGSERYGFESITKLHKREIEAITAVDKSTTYRSWEDLYATLAAIIQEESKEYTNVCLNTSDFLLSNNFIDNADHLTTGVATKAAGAALGGQYPIKLYLDYDVDILRPNLKPKQVLHKAGMFVAYDMTVQAETGHCTHCETDYYLKWCLRQYSRSMQSERPARQFGFHALKFLGYFRRWCGVERTPLTRH